MSKIARLESIHFTKYNISVYLPCIIKRPWFLVFWSQTSQKIPEYPMFYIAFHQRKNKKNSVKNCSQFMWVTGVLISTTHNKTSIEITEFLEYQQLISTPWVGGSYFSLLSEPADSEEIAWPLVTSSVPWILI